MGKFKILIMIAIILLIIANFARAESLVINNEVINYNNVIYVDISGNDTTGDGSLGAPYATIAKALTVVTDGDAIKLGSGTYELYDFDVLVDHGVQYDLIGEAQNTVVQVTVGISNRSQTNTKKVRVIRMIFEPTDTFAGDTKRFAYWTNGAKPNIDFYNCVFRPSQNGTYPTETQMFIWGNNTSGNANDSLSGFYNCFFKPVSSVNPQVVSQNGIVTIQNTAYAVGAITNNPNVLFASYIDNVEYNSSYNITSQGWRNTGTSGVNPDGTVAHMGVYGGIYAWGDWPTLEVTQDIKSRAPATTNIEVNISINDPDGIYSKHRYAWASSSDIPSAGWSAYTTSLTNTMTQTKDGIWYLHVQVVDTSSNERTYTTGEYIKGIDPDTDIIINEELLKYNRVIHVSNSGNDANDGTSKYPYATLSKALTEVTDGDAIKLDVGTYTLTRLDSLAAIGIQYDLVGESKDSVIQLQYSSSNLSRTNPKKVRIIRAVFEPTDSFGDTRLIYWTNGATPNLDFYNCVFRPSPNGTKPSSEYMFIWGNNTSGYASDTKSGFYNCFFQPVNGIATQNVSRNGLITVQNSAYAKGATTTNPYFAFDSYIDNVEYDTNYNITSEGWQNTGATGVNPDGTQANLGVYGGIYAWGDWMVADTTPPSITVLGDSTVEVFQGDTYNDAGATATDDTDGDLTGSIVVVNPVDTNVINTYIVTYNITDAAGNSAPEKTRTVNVVEVPDTTPPDITLSGANPQQIEVGNYIELGATAIDDVDGSVSVSIDKSGLDASTVGEYTVIYSATDSAGNTATKPRDVEVMEEIPAYEGYEVGTAPSHRKYFKYYVGLNQRGFAKIMLVCAQNEGDGSIKHTFTNDEIIDQTTYKFKDGIYYIDKNGKIKKYK